MYNNFFRKGFIEYQVLFEKNNFLNAVHEIEFLIKKNNYSSYMSSFKSYRASKEKYIFGLIKDGFCITLDIQYEKSIKFVNFIRKMNEVTIKYEDQVYLGKTSCVNNQEFKSMYNNYNKFEKIKN